MFKFVILSSSVKLDPSTFIWGLNTLLKVFFGLKELKALLKLSSIEEDDVFSEFNSLPKYTVFLR